MRVKFTPTARDQFLSAVAQDNPSAAAAFRENSAQVLSRLEEFPESGRVLPEFPDLPFREVLVGSYRFFYRIKGAAVWIVAVWHGAQSPDHPPEK